METTAYIALARQGTLRREMDAIANNMANMNTTAYKGERMMFVEHLMRSQSDNFIADQKLAFPRDVASYRNIDIGPIEQTSNPLDVALEDEGYFVVQGPNEERQYTRNGNFRLDNAGQLVTQAGQPVLTDAETPIFFAPEDTNITISKQGTVSTQNGEVGKLAIVRFENDMDLQRIANGVYTTDQEEIFVEEPRVVQGALEGSNVEGILEMTRMIEVSRNYSKAKEMIDKEDERIRKAINELAKASNS